MSSFYNCVNDRIIKGYASAQYAAAERLAGNLDGAREHLVNASEVSFCFVLEHKRLKKKTRNVEETKRVQSYLPCEGVYLNVTDFSSLTYLITWIVFVWYMFQPSQHQLSDLVELFEFEQSEHV